MAPFERATVVSYRLTNCDHCAISNHLALICDRLSPSIKSTGRWVTLGQNLGTNRLTDVSKIFTWSGKDMGLSNTKEILSISSAVWAQCTNVTDRQTDKHDMGEWCIRNRRNRLSAMSPNNRSAIRMCDGQPDGQWVSWYSSNWVCVMHMHEWRPKIVQGLLPCNRLMMTD